jgi:hypothetical protein
MGRAGTRRDQFYISKAAPSNGQVAITDISNYSVPGYNTLYFVNDVYVGMSLAAYQLPANGKYVVDKLITKSSPTSGYQRIDDLYKQNYNDGTWINSWHQEIINTYDANTAIIAEQTIDAGKGTLLAPYQEWFVKTNNWNAQFVKDAPALTTPAGKVYGGVPVSDKGSYEDYLAHGFNLFDAERFPTATGTFNGTLVPNEKRLAFPNPNVFRQALANANQPRDESNPYPSYNQGRTAMEYSGMWPFGWLMDQLQDGNGWVSGLSDGYLGFHERYKEMNPNGKTFGGYGQSTTRYLAPTHNFQPTGGGARSPLDYNTYAKRYQSQQEARSNDPFYQDHGGKTLSSVGVGQLSSVYPFENNEVDMPYIKMHEMDIMLKQDPNNRPLMYMWPLRELPANGMPGYDLSSGANSYIWEHETTSPAGIVRMRSHSVSSLVLSEATAFDGMVRGTGAVYFHNIKFPGNNRNKIGQNDLHMGEWLPANGSSGSFPYGQIEPGTSPLTPLVGFDAIHQGRAKAIRTLDWLGTPNPAWIYASYTLNGVVRTAPADGTAILKHAADYKPMAMILTNPSNGKKVVWAFDPYCQPNAVHVVLIN